MKNNQTIEDIPYYFENEIIETPIKISANDPRLLRQNLRQFTEENFACCIETE